MQLTRPMRPKCPASDAIDSATLTISSPIIYIASQPQAYRDVKQCWYADDASAGGELQHIKDWWDGLAQLDPEYSYFHNPEKRWLVVKEEHYDAASATFAGSGIQLTRHGKQYLGSVIGKAEFIEAFVKMKIEGWINEIEQLSLISKTHPHVVYAAYTLVLSHKWKFLLRTIPNIRDLQTPLETAIRYSLIPSITGKNDLDNLMRRSWPYPAALVVLAWETPESKRIWVFSFSKHKSSNLRIDSATMRATQHRHIGEAKTGKVSSQAREETHCNRGHQAPTRWAPRWHQTNGQPGSHKEWIQLVVRLAGSWAWLLPQ